jgi:hypothetical protein
MLWTSSAISTQQSRDERLAGFADVFRSAGYSVTALDVDAVIVAALPSATVKVLFNSRMRHRGSMTETETPEEVARFTAAATARRR